jgi:hypothetical protein
MTQGLESEAGAGTEQSSVAGGSGSSVNCAGTDNNFRILGR